MEKSVDSVHGAVDRADPVHHGLAAIAALPNEGRRRERGARGPGSRLTGAQKVAERRHVGGEGGGGESSDAGHSGLRNGARRSGGVAGVRGEQAVAVVRHNGDGGGRFGRGSTEVVVGSDEGEGAPVVTGAKGVSRGGARTHARRQWRPLVRGGR
jgi:hypothetical protein